MDHSCAPNAVWISKGKELVIRCISEEKIENISDLRISYIPNLYESTERRRDLLMEDYYFECQCSRCLDEISDHWKTSLLCSKCLKGRVKISSEYVASFYSRVYLVPK